ncbi:MAG: hypothetical protein JO257_10085 [Deltaproteobacteria bacterium]|nr:hypothetical protein [Deltaproteobacteria bacterium]
MANTEPRALTAALASPVFVTKASGMAQHAANRHVERWAPETPAGTNRVRPLKNLGFVDRLVAPWIEAAQRSTSLRMFSSYQSVGAPERPASNVSWVFPRPWYQDELDWMAAARQQTAMGGESASSAMLTTRGTYVAPAQPRQVQTVMPSALYEFVAPSLSVARPEQVASRDAYSPLVPHAATQAASVMARVMAPLAPTRALSPGLRAVLTTMLERTANVAASEPTRVSLAAPELVTPPAPRAPVMAAPADEQATAVADSFAEQRVRIAELQRAAAVATQREVIARHVPAPAPVVSEPARAAAITTRSEAAASSDAAVAAEQARLEERIAQRLAERQAAASTGDAERAAARAEAQRADVARAQEQARGELARATEARRAEIVQRQGEAQRLHESAREAAARDARIAALRSEADAAVATRTEAPRALPAEVTAALAALPPQLQSMVAAGIAARPERAVQAISELGESLRTIELMARSAATGGSFESSRGPRLVMPAGLGGLVSTIEQTTPELGATRGMSAVAARAALASDAARAEQLRGEFARAQASGMTAEAARSAGFAPEVVRALEAARPAVRVPQLSYIAPRAGAPAASTALGATAASEPAALQHVAWADRWLGRFAGAKSQSLDAFTAASASSPEARFAALASAAPNAVFVAPAFTRGIAAAETPATFSPGAAAAGAFAARDLAPVAMPVVSPSEPPPVVRIDDDAETPDDLLVAISQAASRARTPASIAAAAPAAAPSAAADAAMRAFERDTLADLVAHAVPTAPGAGLAAQLASSPFAPALRHVMPLAAAPSFDVRSLFGGGLSMTYLAGLLAPATREIAVPGALPAWASWDAAPATSDALVRDVPDFAMPVVAPTEPARAAAEGEPLAEQLTTMRSALLSWTVDAVDAGGGAPVDARVSAPSVSLSEPARMPTAYSVLESMALPTLGDAAALRELGAIDLAGTTAYASSYAAPGAIAERAQSWSVAQERSSADLAFDFVPPELVLAARVYGLGAAEAAQAARLAIAGPGQLSAMAGAVDRTFVQALAIEHEKRTGKAVTAYPTATSAGSDEIATPAAAAPHATTAFGVERRAPRGAFLWPSAAVAALGLHASAPDGDHGMSVAALELLAAQAVAELGTFAALAPTEPRASSDARMATAAGASASAELPPDADEQSVLSTASALVGTTRRAKFEAMYVALGQSNATRSWSPAARAARALALAGRGDEMISARERAEIAWDVLPVVSIGELGADGEPTSLSTGEVAQRAASQRQLAELSQFVEQRPGLASLSSRAGEALGSYVAPQVASPRGAAASSSSSGGSAARESSGAVTRAPSAAPELVQTGPRFGGGEVELPAWFEQAAKKMFEDRTGLAENIQLSELTLVQTAPANVAASTRGAPSALPAAPAQQKGQDAQADAKIDVDKLANDVYRQILVIMDATRSRNGDPYL